MTTTHVQDTKKAVTKENGANPEPAAKKERAPRQPLPKAKAVAIMLRTLDRIEKSEDRVAAVTALQALVS